MIDVTPTFPPLLSGHSIGIDEDPMDWACARAQDGKLGAGDLVWSEVQNQLRFALVLEPEVERARCAEIAYVAMVAFCDAVGALIPPEVAITFQWPNVIQMNDGEIGMVDLIVSDDELDGIPTWMVLGLDIQLIPDFADMNPGENFHRTTLWDEGCGEINRTELLESTSRHFVNMIHTWSEDGFKPVHAHWLGRLNKKNQLAPGQSPDDLKFVGIDEIGNGLLAFDGRTNSHPMIETLSELRKQAAEAG